MQQNRIIAFIDILGFKELVEHWKTNKGIEKTIEKALIKSIEWVGGKDALKRKNSYWKIRSFSDSFIISVVSSDLGIIEIISGLAAFQRQMFDSGFLIRGGVSIGEHFETNLTTISPGLIDAYNLESTKAIFPRILISEKLISLINEIKDDEIRKDIKSYILIEEEIYFICYLVFEDEDPWYDGQEFYEIHKKRIEEKLREENISEAVQKKYLWLKSFHNWCIGTTAQYVKTVQGWGIESNTWDFSGLLLNPQDEVLDFESVLWSDSNCEIFNFPIQNVNWVKEWPDASSEDDEEGLEE